MLICRAGPMHRWPSGGAMLEMLGIVRHSAELSSASLPTLLRPQTAAHGSRHDHFGPSHTRCGTYGPSGQRYPLGGKRGLQVRQLWPSV